MRIWSLHPRYLDSKGLVALWRETLLAQAVLRGETRGYRNHPQLDRFRNFADPFAAVALYLEGVYEEARERGYNFDKKKIGSARKGISLSVTSGQMQYEWRHLLAKLEVRDPERRLKWLGVEDPEPHRIFNVVPGGVESWERP